MWHLKQVTVFRYMHTRPSSKPRPMAPSTGAPPGVALGTAPPYHDVSHYHLCLLRDSDTLQALRVDGHNSPRYQRVT